MILKQYNDLISSSSAISKVCLQISIFIGIAVTLVYCGSISHYPAGLTIGDTLFFFAASVSFAFVYTLVVMGLMASGMTLTPFLRAFQAIIISSLNLFFRWKGKQEIKRKINFPPLGPENFLIALVGIFLIVFSIAITFDDIQKGMNILGAMVIMGVIYGFWHTKIPQKGEYNEVHVKRVKLVLIVMAYITPIVLAGKDNVLSQSMSKIGVRSEGSIVRLSKQHTEFLALNNIDHQHLTSAGEGVYKNVTVLFSGIGKDTVLRIQDFRITVPSSDVTIGQ